MWAIPDLHGRVTVVTGSSRGAGKGIAKVLGQAGATVYVTGRSQRGQPHEIGGTIEDTAEEARNWEGKEFLFDVIIRSNQMFRIYSIGSKKNKAV